MRCLVTLKIKISYARVSFNSFLQEEALFSPQFCKGCHRVLYANLVFRFFGKVRTLMRSIAELKKKLVIATAQGKDHRRSAMIRAMRTRLREQVQTHPRAVLR